MRDTAQLAHAVKSWEDLAKQISWRHSVLSTNISQQTNCKVKHCLVQQTMSKSHSLQLLYLTFIRLTEWKIAIPFPHYLLPCLRDFVRWRGQILIFIFVVTIPDLLQFTTGRREVWAGNDIIAAWLTLCGVWWHCGKHGAWFSLTLGGKQGINCVVSPANINYHLNTTL